MSEFSDKFPDHKNVAFEETDGGLDRSHESLGAAFNTQEKGKHTQSTIAPCTVVIGRGYRDTGTVSMCGLMAPKRRTSGSTSLLQGKVLFHMLSEVFMPLC